MKLNGIEFDCFVASPGIGKSYLADNYINFVDLDEIRLRCKYFVPENISRQELELTKGNRTFEKRPNFKQLLTESLQNLIHSNSILLAAPHDEIIKILLQNNLKYCFVYPSMECKQQIINRWKERGNTEEFIKENSDCFDKWYQQNILDTRPAVHYILQQNEFLLDVVKKAGVTLIKK